VPDIRAGDIDEPDRRTIIANDLVVDVIANEDGSYIEFYPYSYSETRQRVDFSDVLLDRFYGGVADGKQPSLRAMVRCN